jgi:hypothetical protein
MTEMSRYVTSHSFAAAHLLIVYTCALLNRDWAGVGRADFGYENGSVGSVG